MARLVLFGPAREAAGTSIGEFEGLSVDEVLREAVARYGTNFADVLSISQIWMNGEPSRGPVAVGPYDEIAVLPPISGG
jgi:molybdopterin converting factor small subunit